MSLRFDELPDGTRHVALDAFWQECLAGTDATSYLDDFSEIADPLITPVSEYFYKLNGTRFEIDFSDFASAISFSNPWGHSGLWVIEIAPENCIGSDSAFEAAAHGVPLDDIEWDFTIPDPDAIHFDHIAIASHMAWCVSLAEKNLDGLCAIANDLDSFLNGVWLEFYAIYRIVGDILLEDRRPAILDALTKILEPDLAALGPVFNPDGTRTDGIRSTGTGQDR